MIRALHRIWQTGCLLALALLLGGRLLRYTVASPPPAVDDFLGGLMLFDAQTFLWGWAYPQVFWYLVAGGDRDALGVALLFTLAVLGGIALLLRSGRLIRREAGVWRATPLMTSILCGACLALNALFDANPFIALVCLSSLALLAAARRLAPGGGIAAVGAGPLALGGVAFASAWALAARDAADALTVVAWTLFALLAARFLPRWLGRRELGLLLLLAVAPANVVPAVLPLFLPLHGGQRLQEGLAYHYCEIPERGLLLATVPGCDSVSLPGDCETGAIAVYDRGSLDRVDTWRFFSERYSGRLEKLLCIGEDVYVAVQSTRIEGENRGQSAMSFSVASPRDFTPMIAGEGLGSNLAYDARSDALYFVGEFTHRVLRLDRRTGETLLRDDPGLARPWKHPVEGKRVTASLGATLVPAFDRLFVYEFHRGRYVYALDLSTLETRETYTVNAGGGWGVSGDPERGRLVTASLRGLEVLDVATGEVVARKRLGLGVKEPVVDAAADRLYVGTTIEGKLRVLDGETLEILKQIPIGFGTRHPYLSRGRERLLATSSREHSFWDLRELFGRPAGAAGAAGGPDGAVEAPLDPIRRSGSE